MQTYLSYIFYSISILTYQEGGGHSDFTSVAQFVLVQLLVLQHSLVPNPNNHSLAFFVMINLINAISELLVFY